MTPKRVLLIIVLKLQEASQNGRRTSLTAKNCAGLDAAQLNNSDYLVRAGQKSFSYL